jgi:hypothetical protein
MEPIVAYGQGFSHRAAAPEQENRHLSRPGDPRHPWWETALLASHRTSFPQLRDETLRVHLWLPGRVLGPDAAQARLLQARERA